MVKHFEIVSEDKKTKARVGKLKTGHGVVETPFFMPVATKMAAKYVTNQQLEEIGAQVIIVNGFIVSLTPGEAIIKKAGGLHKFMNFHRTIYTDSGGYQLIRSSFSPKVDFHGIHFKSPFNGKVGLLKPEDSIRIQNDLGSDIAMCLDDMPPYVKDRKEIEKSVKITHDWAKRCRAEFERNKKKGNLTNKCQLLFGIIQGGVFKDLREESSKFINSLDFDGVAIGGFGEGESSEELFGMVEHCEKFIDKNKIRYLMGIGSPESMLEAISHGIDCFDSTFPTQNGRRNTIFTWEGKIKILNKKHEHELSPLDEKCGCFVCKNFTRAYLHHLAERGEPNAKIYLTYHNVYFVHRMLERARAEIKAGTFSEFFKDMKRKYQKEK